MNKKIRVWFHNLFVKFCPKFILNRLVRCNEIARWAADKENLSFAQRVELFVHLLYCPPCWAYNKQLKIMKDSIKNIFQKREKLQPEEAKRVDKIAERVIEKHSH